MMSPYVYLVLAAICAGVAVFALVSAQRPQVLGGRPCAVGHRLRARRRVVPRWTPISASIWTTSPVRASCLAIATRLGGLFSGRLTTVREEAIREQLMAAGLYMISARDDHRLPSPADHRPAGACIPARGSAQHPERLDHLPGGVRRLGTSVDIRAAQGAPADQYARSRAPRPDRPDVRDDRGGPLIPAVAAARVGPIRTAAERRASPHASGTDDGFVYGRGAGTPGATERTLPP